MSLAQYIPSTQLQLRCDELGVNMSVTSDADVGEHDTMTEIAAALGNDFVWRESGAEMADGAFLNKSKYIIRLTKGRRGCDDVAFLMMKQNGDTAYETKYDCIEHTQFTVDVGCLLYDLAAEVALFDAANVAVAPRGETAETAAHWIVSTHMANARRIGGVTIVSRPQNKKYDQG